MSNMSETVYRGDVKVTYQEVTVKESPKVRCGYCGQKPAVEVLLEDGRRVGICDPCANSSWGDYVFSMVHPSQVKDLPEEAGRKQFLAARRQRQST